MSNRKNYIPPPNNKNIFSKGIDAIKNVYANLTRDYYFSLIPHLFIIVPVLFILYTLLMGYGMYLIIGDPSNSLVVFLAQATLLLSSTSLTLAAALFYPYSIYWYTRSFFNRMFDYFYFFGSFWGVILRKTLMFLGHIFLAGFFSPIMGVRTWKK